MVDEYMVGFTIGILSGIKLSIDCYNAIKQRHTAQVKLHPVQYVKLTPA